MVTQVSRTYVDHGTVIRSDWLNWVDYVINHPSIVSSGAVNVQPALVSGTNIKTINGQNILGAGDLTIAGGSGGISGPAGVDMSVQFNDSGGLAGGNILLWNKTSNTLFVVNGNIAALNVWAAGAANTVGFSGSTSGNATRLQTSGSDTNVDLDVDLQGTGSLNLLGGLKINGVAGVTQNIVVGGSTLHFTNGVLTSVT